MAIVNGVAADGSEDFTSLQAWENFADDQVVRHEALVFAGGSVGAFAIAGWSHTLGTRISPAPGARHDGTDGNDNSVALIIISSSGFVTLNDITGRVDFEGIKVVNDDTNANGILTFNNNTVNGCLVVIKQGNTTNSFGVQFRFDTSNTRIINNIVIGKTANYNSGIGSRLSGATMGEVSHNVVMGTAPAVGAGINSSGGTIANAFNNYTFFFAGTFTTASNNASADTSAPGTNPIINLTEANEFTNPQSDANLLSTSQLRGAAIDRTSILGLEVDALNRSRVAPFDIGAIQFGVVGGYQRARMAPVGARRFASLAGRTL